MGQTIVLENIVFAIGEGPIIYTRLTISRISEENGVDGYIIVVTDVTELKASYDALDREKSSVEHTVEIRTKELREAQQRLLETDKLKTEFVRLTSHNLRTPLATLIGNLEMLQTPGLSDEERSQYLSGAETSSERLRELVADLLTINNIEAGDKLERENVTAKAILDPAIAEAKRLASAHNNELKINLHIDGARLNANASRLRAAINNVLDNAIKYTDNGHINLLATNENNRLHIVVSDDGVGISEDEVQKLFTKFHRGTDTLEYNYEGEGIGLYLTKLIIEDHGGTIHIDSTEGEGTTVTISLPLTD